MLIVDKKKRYDRFVDWMALKIFKNKISILEQNGFSEKRKVYRNNAKLIATVIFSQDPESSAWRGPAIKVRIFENQNTQSWNIDLIHMPFGANRHLIYKNLDFAEFINEARMKIMHDFIKT